VDVIERRAAWIAISDAVVLAFAASGGFAFGVGGIGTWELVTFIATLVCLGGAGVLLVAALAPDAFRPFSLDERARFVFYAFALWALALVLIVVLSSHAAIEAHRHPNFG
jgi:Trk-type K+ transport system membrane component